MALHHILISASPLAISQNSRHNPNKVFNPSSMIVITRYNNPKIP